MEASCRKHLNEIEQELATLDTEGVFTPHLGMVLYKYTQYLVNLLDEHGLELRGESFKYGVPVCLLVVKLTAADGPYVVFVSGLSRLSCYQIFLERLELGTLELRPDQYA